MKHPKFLRLAAGAAVALMVVAATSVSIASAAVAAPSVALVPSVNPSVSGQRVTLRATVTDPSQPASGITGTMTFSDGASVLGTSTVTAARASLSTSVLLAGAHSLTASFAPAAGGAAVVSPPSTQTVTPADTTITIASSRATANYGDNGNVTATLKPVAPGTGIPTGSVDFLIDGGWFWNAPLDAHGKAVLPLSAIYPAYYPGTYSITATYAGDGNYNPSATTAAVAQTLVGISSPPVSTVTLDAKGRPLFAPSSFRLSSANPVGCNVTITNNTPGAIALTYGTPGSWKRLPGGVIASGASGGVGVGLSNFTGYFSAMGAANYVAVHCV
jgi:hypothetical protein